MEIQAADFVGYRTELRRIRRYNCQEHTGDSTQRLHRALKRVQRHLAGVGSHRIIIRAIFLIQAFALQAGGSEF